MRKHYMALSPNFYGYGKTPVEAERNLRKSGGKVKGCGLYLVPDDYWIDDFGMGHGSKPAELVSGKDHRD